MDVKLNSKTHLQQTFLCVFGFKISKNMRKIFLANNHFGYKKTLNSVLIFTYEKIAEIHWKKVIYDNVMEN